MLSMYERILVPIDGSAPAEAGLREAIAIAREMKSRLVVLNVVSEFPVTLDGMALTNYDEILAALNSAGEALVAQAAHQAREAGVEVETSVVDAAGRSACDVIVQEAATHHCALIAMGTHGRRGLRRMTLGSDAELVLRQSPVPVLLAKAS